MRPINLLRGLLTHNTTSTSDEPDDEQGSLSGSWLFFSNSNEENVTPTRVTTTDQSCQTQPNSTLATSTPRSTVRPLDAHSTKAALPPPTFLPKSKLPRLHYGGLTTPDLHCFGSSLTPTATPVISNSPTFLEPTAKSLPSPATFRKATTTLQSSTQKTRWKLLEPALGSWVYFMKLDLHPNSCPKSIPQPLWNNTSIALPTAWVLEAYSCTFKYGIIGLTGVNATLFLQLKPLYLLSSIIYMPPITSNARKIPNLPEPG